MSNIQTAEQLIFSILESIKCEGEIEYLQTTEDGHEILTELIEEVNMRTRLHVEAALTEAHKAAKWREQMTMQGLQVTISKASIMTSYPPENII
jgi:hypothetical protein